MPPRRGTPDPRRSPSPRWPTDLQAVWSAPTTDARLKKRIVRTVIHEAVADLDDSTAEIVLVIHWVGGAHTEHRLPRRRRGQRNSTSADIVEAVRTPGADRKDDVIAGILNRNGLKTGNGNRWTRERVTSLRSHYRIPVYRAARGRMRAMAQPEPGRGPRRRGAADAALGGGTGRDRRHAPARGWPVAVQPRRSRRSCRPSPRSAGTQAVPKHPAVPDPAQQNLFPSTT